MENVEKPTHEFVKQIEDFMEEGVIEYSFEGRSAYQNRFYDECMHTNQFKHNWYANPLQTSNIRQLQGMGTWERTCHAADKSFSRVSQKALGDGRYYNTDD